MKNKLILFFLLFSVLGANSYANINPNCSKNFDKNILKNLDDLKIELIEVKVKNYRKWSKNGVRILIDSSRNTPQKFKRRFAANIKITYEGNLQCEFPAKIRHHGDFKDHIQISDNSFVQSLDVHLSSGNIKGVTKFKLLLKNTRGKYEDEILMTELLREFNYLSPRTKFIKAIINEIETEVIFQEKAGKELLEFNKRREGPIFEGQEDYMFEMVKNVKRDEKSNSDSGLYTLMQIGVNAQLTKQINPNWNKRGKNFFSISKQAISNLNLSYLLYINGYQNKKNNSNFNSYNLSNNLLALNDPEKKLKLEVYNLLMFAGNGSHGLAPYNRKFYWNALENYFEPINYDSGFDINDEPWYFYQPFNNETLNAFDKLELLLKNVDISKLHLAINKSGIKLNTNEVKNKISKLLNNLDFYKKEYNKIDQNLINFNINYKLSENMWKKYMVSLNKINPRILLVYSENSNFYACITKNLECSKIELSVNQKSDLFEGNLKINKKTYQYIGNYFKTNYVSNISKFEKIKLSNSYFYYDENINFNFNKEKNIVDIYQLKYGARAFFKNGSIENMSINFHGYKNYDDFDMTNYPIDENNLTGCVSLINLNIKNVTLSSNNSNCEDAINLINVNGSINTVDVKNSYSDSLDIDFSNVEINNINVSSSRNDCVDFSSGEYKLNKAVLLNCGDKGLSVGERSILEVSHIIVDNSNIGVASKDSSITSLINADLKNLETCVSAYNKKQEYFGSLLRISKFKCENYYKKTNRDKNSLIIIKN